MPSGTTQTKWKRGSMATSSIVGETISSTGRGLLFDFDQWSQEKVAETIEQYLSSEIKVKRPDCVVFTMAVPPVQLVSNSIFKGALFSHSTEHIPLGVLLVQAKNVITLYVRTIPFGSLECSPSENFVMLYLSRGGDVLGNSHESKWKENNLKKTSIDELSHISCKRIVLFPSIVDPTSQSIEILDNGIIRVKYTVVSPAPKGSKPGEKFRKSILNLKSISIKKP
jgi:hypothetical protein